jgi:hypothetical protein
MKQYTIHSTLETYVQAETEEEALEIQKHALPSQLEEDSVNYLEDYKIDGEWLV